MQSLFWQQENYYGVNLTALHGCASQGYFSQVHIEHAFELIWSLVPILF